MVHHGPNLQIYKLQRSCFHSKHGESTALGLKIGRKNTNQCFLGPRMEDHGVLSSNEHFW